MNTNNFLKKSGLRGSFAIFLLFILPFSVLAQQFKDASFFQESQNFEEEKVKAQMEIDETATSNVSKKDQLLNKLEEHLSSSNAIYDNIDENIVRTKDRLKSIGKTLKDLNGQLKMLGDEIETTKKQILNIRTNIASLELKLKSIFQEIELKEISLLDQKNLLADYLRFIYVKRQIFYKDNNLDTVKLLFADANVSSSLRDKYYFEKMEEEGEKLISTLNSNIEELNAKKTEYDENRLKFEDLNEKLTMELSMLSEQELSKKTLLEETKGKQEIYRQLLIYSKLEQEQIKERISSLSTQISSLKGRLKDLSDADLTRIQENVNQSLKQNYLLGITAGDIGDLPLISWPQLPVKGLSAFFNYPEDGYEAAFGFKHYAIDIPVPQGSPIHAPAPGIVVEVVDRNSKGYNYIILAHNDGFTSLYGHVYESNVKVGNEVNRGDILGLSGGTPGTKGSGLFTTGPHIHFEFFKDGKQVDPLLFLPLRFLDRDDLPSKYHELYDEQQKKWQESEAATQIESVSKEVDEEIKATEEE